jgi:hypothetical protein
MQVLTDAQWAKFEAAIAAVKIRGARPRKDDRSDHLAAGQRCEVAIDPGGVGRLASRLSAVSPLGRAGRMGRDHGSCGGAGDRAPLRGV